MISENKQHQKHAKLQRPHIGQFGRNEIAILGTPCGEIKKLSARIIERLSKGNKIAYIDADHKGEEEGDMGFVHNGLSLGYTDKIDFQRFDFNGNLDNPYKSRYFFNDQDLILINGNHFKAKKQIVVIDSRKPLEKKLVKLTDVSLFLTSEEPIPAYLKEHINNWEAIPRLDVTDIEGIAAFIQDEINENVPILKGLVLAGGVSQRMKKDKGKLNYHGIEQREYLYNMLSDLGLKTSMSCRVDQVEELRSFKPIEDTFIGLGPLGAILSAFRTDPNAAWLVVACDLPLVDKAGLKKLIENRSHNNAATAYSSPDNEFPEPLIGIWEPKIYPLALQLLGQGYSCARKVLINSNTKLIEAENKDILRNVNHPEEFEAVLNLLK